MPESVHDLFDEWAARYRRGEHPGLREYLDRAGVDRDVLAALADRFLQAAPAPEPDEERVALARAWVEGEPPLLALRVRRGLRRAQVVAALMGALGLDPAKRDKVRRYYHELEAGVREPRRVDPSVLEALAATLKVGVSDLLAWRPHATAAVKPAYLRVDASLVAPDAAPRGVLRPAEEEPDEVDRLFGVA